MSHPIHSPVARWPGSVTLPDYLNFAQYRAWREGVNAALAVFNRNKPENPAADVSWEYDEAEYRFAFMTGVCGVVEAWALEGGLPKDMTPDRFPINGSEASKALFNWLVGEIGKVASDVDGDDPKSPAPSSAG